MKLNRILSISMMACIALTTHLSHAEEAVYKWKDKRGIIHYSSKIPNGVEYEVVKKNLKKKSVDGRHHKAEQELLDKAKTEEASQTRKEQTEQLNKQMAAYCTSLKERLATVQSGQLIKIKGKFMSGDERDKEIQSLNKKISADCKS